MSCKEMRIFCTVGFKLSAKTEVERHFGSHQANGTWMEKTKEKIIKLGEE
jgi:hypothetical protein